MRSPIVISYPLVRLAIAFAIFLATSASFAENFPAEQVPNSVGQHGVHLTWDASQSKHIVGYNVYRGKHSSGPYHKINQALDPKTKYVDHDVTSGHHYYYVATAVNSKGRESSYSTPMRVVVP